ncbi:hypothetical protein T265_04115 [Opisthorchis viverrini]|uniref:Uncharacterized protein n=1 Tax=Opisthorchis viverrini TaxID=6198 RepID=A0A074ZQ29_OPIVI|nr:hypothetical protein T265_04115 [Opisthorchis viverrini]KER29176.1 hypothetical protein T265_04115 [Opisthorchis viverrini]
MLFYLERIRFKEVDIGLNCIRLIRKFLEVGTPKNAKICYSAILCFMSRKPAENPNRRWSTTLEFRSLKQSATCNMSREGAN